LAAKFMKQIKGHFSNETAIVTPNGEMLSIYPEEALQKWRQLSRAERRAVDNLGKYDVRNEPSPPAGGLVLNVFARPLVLEAGQLVIYRNPKAHLSKEPGRDHLWLTRAEWKSLVPAQAKVGERRTVPGPIADRLCRRYLIDLVRIGGEGVPRRPEDVLARDLVLIVEEVTPARLRLHLQGTPQFVTRGPEYGAPRKEGRKDTFHLRGIVEYDRKAAVFTRFDVVSLCETGHYDEIGKKLVPLGVAFELNRGETPADRVRPHSYYDKYFGARR
jgi:hypothetical protein